MSIKDPKPVATIRDLQFRLEYLVLRGCIAAVRAMPLDTAVPVFAHIWRWLAPMVARKRHRRALDNLRTAFPEKTEQERLAIALEHWANLGRIMVETMQIDRVLADPSRMDFVNRKMFARYRGKLGPAVGITLHMGNWELAVWPMTALGMKPGAVYRSVNNPYVDQYLRAQRAELYPSGLFGRGRVEGEHGEAQRTARLITDFVRRGGRLGMICDLYDRTGIPVPFFGRDAPTQAIGAIIARRLGTRIWLTRCLRIGNESRFRIDVHELRVPRSANQSEDVRWIVAAMQQQFEAWVREAPEQWMWSNRRWQ
jgi:Kdo2-lipid IVA lauroyltransferase/acyltransferase